MRVVNVTCGMVMLLVAVIVVIGSQGNPYWDNFAPGPSFMPYWTTAFGSVVGCVLLVAAFQQGGEEGRPEFSDLGKAGTVSLLLLAFLFLMPWLGMLFGGALFMLAILVGILRRPLGYSLLTVLINTVILYGIFDYWLGLGLPKSVIGL